MLNDNIIVANAAEASIKGRAVRIAYRFDDNLITLFLVKGNSEQQISCPCEMGYPEIDGREIKDFSDYTCRIERNCKGLMGEGERITVSSFSNSTGLSRTVIMETSDTIKGAIYLKTLYSTAKSSIKLSGFTQGRLELAFPGDTVWSFNGGGEGPTTFYDQLQKINLNAVDKFYRENIQDYTAAAIPVADIYTPGGGITIGDASATRREVRTPVRQTDSSVEIYIKRQELTIEANTVRDSGQCFIILHEGDYFNGLRGYKNAMEHLGIIMQTNISDRSYSLRWEGWGWCFDWTPELIIGQLDFLQSVGVKQITIDDAWYDSAGDWELNLEKFPNGESDMINLVNEIHAHGMTALLWWRPCDGGKSNSRLYNEHPDYFVKCKDGSTARLCGPGKSCNCHNTADWSTSVGYALCPASEGAIASQVDFINRAMNRWGFDGFKGDFVWSMPHCYDKEHHHNYPQDSTERQPEIYRAVREAMVKNDPDAFNLLCNCGAPLDYYSLPFMTQAVTADPTSPDQTRTRVKAYKALLGDYFPVTTDHSQVWFATTIGTGALLIEKRALYGADADEYKAWADIINKYQLHKGRFVGGLYSYGFDPYETYAVEKDGVMFYAFYRDGERCLPDKYPDIELKGLKPDKLYRIVDYVNNRVLATNLMGERAVFQNRFTNYLLVAAVEITQPDNINIIDKLQGKTFVNATNKELIYSTEQADKNSDKRALYEGESVEFSFAGKSFYWHAGTKSGQNEAEVYLDGVLAARVNVGGVESENETLFEAPMLAAAIHKVKIKCTKGIAQITGFSYNAAIPDPVFEKVDANSTRITYGGNWELEKGEEFYNGSCKFTHEQGAYAEFKFVGTAIRWYGKRVISNYGGAKVYLDGNFLETAVAYGPDVSGQILYEKGGLEPTEHIFRIVHTEKTIDIDYLSYALIN